MSRFLALFVLLAFAAPASAAERFRVVFFNIGEPAPFWNVFAAASQAAADDLDIDLEILNAHGDHLRMIEQAQEVAARPVRPDYALVNNEKGAAPRMLEALTGAGVKTLVIMSVLEGADAARFGKPREKLPTYLGTLRPDHEGAGHEIARMLVEAARVKFGSPSQLLAISGAKATFAATERDKGLKRALGESPDVVLTQLVHSAWARDKAHRQAAGLLRRWPGTRLIWAANDPMALGAMDAVRDRGEKPGEDVLIGGLNWSVEAVKLVERGELVTTVGGHFLGGAWALVLLRDHHDGIDFAPENLETLFPMGVIDRTNAAEYLAHFGDERWDRIDFAKFSKSLTPAVKRYDFTLDRVFEQFR